MRLCDVCGTLTTGSLVCCCPPEVMVSGSSVRVRHSLRQHHLFRCPGCAGVRCPHGTLCPVGGCDGKVHSVTGTNK
jgi:hypothetical protein